MKKLTIAAVAVAAALTLAFVGARWLSAPPSAAAQIFTTSAGAMLSSVTSMPSWR